MIIGGSGLSSMTTCSLIFDIDSSVGPKFAPSRFSWNMIEVLDGWWRTLSLLLGLWLPGIGARCVVISIYTVL